MSNLLDMMNYEDYNDDDDFIRENEKPGKSFFDASVLPDAPSRQLAANGSEVFILHIAFPSHKLLLRAIKALSNGQRSFIYASSKEVSFNGVAKMKDSMNTFLELWENKLSGIAMPKRRKGKRIDEDEAQEPIPF